MTVSETALALGIDGETVRRHIKSKWPDSFENGKRAHLDEAQVTYVKLMVERSGRNDLRNVAELPKTDLEKELLIAQAMQFQQEKIAILQSMVEEGRNQIAIMQPKAEFFDAVADSKTAINMGDAAKVLAVPGLGQNKLFEFLRGCKILMPNNQPFQKYVDSGYFRVIEQKYEADGEIRISLKTLVYQKGLDYIRRAIDKLWVTE